MKYTTVSSLALGSGPWGAEHHIPADPSAEARDLATTHALFTRLRSGAPGAATTDEWNTARRVIEERVAARLRRAEREATRATVGAGERGTLAADRELLAPLIHEDDEDEDDGDGAGTVPFCRSVDLMDRIGDMAREHFPHMPFLLTTDRCGRYDTAYRLRGRHYQPMAARSMPPATRKQQRAELARAVLQYAAHPDADPVLFTQNGHFPKSVELTVSWGRDAVGDGAQTA